VYIQYSSDQSVPIEERSRMYRRTSTAWFREAMASEEDALNNADTTKVIGADTVKGTI
jgi:hypothetical protein